MSFKSGKTKRQPSIFIAVGEQGVGKTYRNVKEIEAYLKDNPKTGKKGRKVLCFDVNDDDYPMYKTVDLKNVSKLKAIRARRIRPLTAQGKGMSNKEKQELVKGLSETFRDGMLVLDDIDKYMTRNQGQETISLLTTGRHRNLDLLISHQSLAKVSTNEWENCAFLRIHKTLDDICRIDDRLPTAKFLIYIGFYIVEENYERVIQAFRKGEISEDQMKAKRSFCVYVNLKEKLIRGCSKEAFIRGCAKHVQINGSSMISSMLKEQNFKGEKAYEDYRSAATELIKRYLHYYEN